MQPRKKIHELKSFKLPEGAPTMTEEEVMKGNGLNGAPIFYMLNGKVMEFTVPIDSDPKFLA
jgi:hypothetical protein